MKRMNLLLLILLIVSPSYAQEAQLWVTKDFSTEILVNKTVSIADDSVMSLLKNNAHLETAFGGAFVTGINGIFSDNLKSEKRDWFYYVNGVMANVGGLQYFPKTGD